MAKRTKNRRQTKCRRCGTCCLKGGPALHIEDQSLVSAGIIDKQDLYTLRKGEVVRNNDDTLAPLNHEIIKIKGAGEDTWACRFYDSSEKACRIYSRRPVECRALKCWDPGPLQQVMTLPYLQRTQFLEPGEALQKVIVAHEDRCAYQTMADAVKALNGPAATGAADRILDLLHYDQVVRTFVPEKLKLNRETMDFFFGRPMTTTIQMYGLKVRQEGNDFRLVPGKR